MLHIHNGDSSANIMKEYGLAGEHVAFREALMAGPAPRGLSRDRWLDVRAAFLARDYGLELEVCRRELASELARIENLSAYNEVVFWFEHDLFCQVNLIFLLGMLAESRPDATRLNLICVGEFPGVEDFRGLGQLSGEQMATLFDSRKELTGRELDLAARAWAAYSSPDPAPAIEAFVDSDTSMLPFLAGAFRLHLARFPSVRNGLGRIENCALDLIARGETRFGSLFRAFGDKEPGYGAGDAQFWNDLKRISEGPRPLVIIKGVDDLNQASRRDRYDRGDRYDRRDRYHDAEFELTEDGKAAREGKLDFIEANGADYWLGGVHLAGQSDLWRWDEQAERLMRS